MIGKVAWAAGAGLLGVALWWRRHPSACPYAIRFAVDLPHPFITRPRLREVLDPRPGERMLEVGPGTGYYAVPVAGWLRPGGTLALADLQERMLDQTARRARERGLDNVEPRVADATALPFEDDSFDAVYATVMLGEVPDQEAALREFRRVTRPGGRVVIGEMFPDFHMVPFGQLRERAERAGLRFESRVGNPLGYFARFGVA